jgi:putative drug exporter of the RND superfamily
VASRLYLLGRLAYRRRRIVLALWVALLVAAGAAASALSGPYSDEFSIPGTESQEALDVLAERFPQAGLEQASANVVFAAPEGERLDDPANAAAVTAVLEQVRQGERVAVVSDPFAGAPGGGVSPDGRIALATATYTVQPLGIEPADREALFDSAEPGREAGLQVEFGGTASTEQQPESHLGELLGVLVAAVVLLVFFGSAVAAGIPLVTALLGVGVGMAGISILTGFVELSSTAPVLALMLGLAVGIDYALFIASRYRHELLTGREPEDAAGRAVGTAGSAVVFAGLTVVIALAGLAVVNIPFMTVMGLGAAGTVVIAVLVAVTLLPALLGFAGRRVLGRTGRAAVDTEGDVDSHGTLPLGHRWAAFVTRRKVPVLLVTLLGLGIVALPATDLRTAFPDEGQQPAGSTQRLAYDLLAEGFGPGSNGPLVVVVEADDPAAAPAALESVTTALAQVDGVVAVTPPVPNETGDTFLVTAVPATGPADPETEAVVERIRDLAPAIRAETGARVSVTGQTGLLVDVTNRLSQALPVYLLVVVGLALLLLTVVFRSLLVPIKAALGFVLTVVTTFGAVVAVFQWGWLSGLLGIDTTGPIMAFLPMFMIAVIFGLAMDYEVFLVTRMREEHVHGAGPVDAVVTGFRHSGRVVTAAALIMISVFGAFLLAPDPITKSLGFAFAFGIAVDAFVVRMTLVPAVLAMLGERAWWLPAWLDRVLPRVDVEGTSLQGPEPAREDELARV